MRYFDEELLDNKREKRRRKFINFETGIYVDDDLITFEECTLSDLKIKVYLPNNFIVMPMQIKNMKYPSKEAPEIILTSLDSTVNLGFNNLSLQLKEEEIQQLSEQFQTAIKNINPAIVIEDGGEGVTDEGRPFIWFEYRGYCVDGQNYNRIFLVEMGDFIIHGIFNCHVQDKDKWINIAVQLIKTIKIYIEEE